MMLVNPFRFGVGPVMDGLVLWLDASQIVGLNDGDPVSTWPDSSGNGNDATQATASKKPTYETGVQNGLPVVRLDGVDDFLRTASFTAIPQPLTYFVVLNSVNGNSGQVVFDGVVSSPRCLLGIFPINTWDMYSNGADTVAGVVSSGSFNLLTALFSGSSSTLTINSGIPVTVNPGTDGTTGVSVGVRFSDTQNWGGDVGELLFYNRALSTAEREANEAYLRNKWGTP